MKLSKVFSKTKAVSKCSSVTVIEKKQLQKIIGGIAEGEKPTHSGASDASAGITNKD